MNLGGRLAWWFRRRFDRNKLYQVSRRLSLAVCHTCCCHLTLTLCRSLTLPFLPFSLSFDFSVFCIYLSPSVCFSLFLYLFFHFFSIFLTNLISFFIFYPFLLLFLTLNHTYFINALYKAREIEYFSDYNEILNEYYSELNLELGADLQPPSDLLIEVLVLEDCGEILTENGLINLNKGTRQFMRRSDVEHLIRQGKCTHETDVL